MGDGGVACVPTQHIMEQFSISDKLCGGKNGSSKFNPKSLKFTERKMKMKSKREEKAKKGGKNGVKGVENGVVCSDKEKVVVVKEEVEEGELGYENGEFVPEKPPKFEIKSEVEKWRKGDVEKEEHGATGKWRKGKVEKGEFRSGRSRADETDSGLWRVQKDEVEKGEFFPERRHRTDMGKDDTSYSKVRWQDSAKDKGWKLERERTPTGKYGDEKEFSSGGNRLVKRSSGWEGNKDRTPKMSSKLLDEESPLKSEASNGKIHGREYSSGSRLKRRGTADSERKHSGDFAEFVNSKSRRISDDSNRSAYAEQYSRLPSEGSYRNVFASRNMSSDRGYSSRHYDSSVSSRTAFDRHNTSPRHSDRSPRDRIRYSDHRDRSPVRRERSPYDRSPYDRSRHHDQSPIRRDRSPYDRSPYGRSRSHDQRNRSPSYSEKSPQDQARYLDRRDRTPNFLEPSPLNRSRPSKYRETNRKGGSNEKRPSHYECKGKQEKLSQKDINEKDLESSAKESEDASNLEKSNGSIEKSAQQQLIKEEQSHSPSKYKETPQVNGATEELLSMEEDMDICDTPPHVPVVADSTTGKWFYLDHYGMEHGPSKLCDLKILVEEGFLVSDHLIKHLDSDRWVTVENAVSPLVTANFTSIVSDTVTQLVSPPEAPGNSLEDLGNIVQADTQTREEMIAATSEPTYDSLSDSENPGDLLIDERVGALLEGLTIIPGRELETVGEALQMTFELGEWERWGHYEGVARRQRPGEGFFCYPDFASKEPPETGSITPAAEDKDNTFAGGDTGDWFAGQWSCKGGDWKRTDEAALDKSSKKKFVLNDGYPLCQMPKSGYEDPRRQHKDELYYPAHSRRLDLPPWAFSSSDDFDSNVASRSSQTKPPVPVRGVKGTMLPVIRINACVVKDHGSFISEPRKARGKERYSSRSSRHYSSTDSKRQSEEGISYSKSMQEEDVQGHSKSITPITTPKDRLCNAEDLQLHCGDWFFLDGTGHEQGPLSFSELQVLADQGIIQKHSSVFRKFDKVWVPVTSDAEPLKGVPKIQQENKIFSGDTSVASVLEQGGAALSRTSTVSSSFHCLHPQFIGYTRGKLHELVMKSYKSREFAAAINEVLDPWINLRQPRKEIEKYVYNPMINYKYQRSADQLHAGKRARLLGDGSEEETEEGILTLQRDEYLFDDLCGDATFCKEDSMGSEIERGSWGLLDGRLLARVFHFLRVDIRSLVYAALTCKHWRSGVKFYKDISKQADLSSLAPNCTDPMMWSIVNGYNMEKLTALVLCGCTSITSGMLEEILRLLPCLSSVDIRGCSQFEDLPQKFPDINWVKSRGTQSKLRSLKHITEESSLVNKNYNGVDCQDSSGLKEYLESLSKRDATNQLFRRSLYKRSKLFDARRSSSILSRGAHLRRLAIKKSGNGYKRMEEFLASSLKDIMKENAFDFFVPKVAKIEDRMKSGYYANHGLSSVKEDISRMCRDALKDALKVKNRGDTRDMNRIINLFIHLATSLEGISKSSVEKDETMRTRKEESPPGFCSASSKFKKLNKVTERKNMNRSNGSSFSNGGSVYGDYASDREIRRRLSKLNKASMDSGSETSDDHERSSEETQTESESSASDTESDLDLHSEGGGKQSGENASFTADDGLDFQADDREWGARMTKASLVPPVTRKYEVIDHYVIVADQEEVQRKMQVSLPEDYAEKLIAQKIGTEESDMEIPEVKDYKPRKQLGDEVLEQEVYGIDPYTHNLLLDSMPGDSDWPLLEKHLFVEDVLLRTLNKQVRDFTGTGNTPMKYPLRPVVEEILRTAEKYHDKRNLKVCQFILNAMDSRPEDNYVAYRKGLGVVCNKEGGFGEDDFVVEFLGEVYPTWKWFEKQDGIRSLQKNSKDPAPEFYNIYLERPKGDGDGYDVLVVDAMHKANYASRICHSCRPNCEAKVTAVDGQYQIGIYTVRPIRYGEEVTFDYNSVTESKEEHEASVCLCGSQVCRGSYLNLTGEGAYQKVLKERHGILDRHRLMIEACERNSVSDEDYIELGRAGLGSCLLGGLPDWLIAYSARLVRFINFERTKLPEEILKYNLEEKRKYFAEIFEDVERTEAEVQAEGVYNQRLQNLALTLDKVRYVMRCNFGDPKKAPPPLEKLTPEEAVSFIWKGEGSLVEELIQSMAPHMVDSVLNDLRLNIRAHDPSGSCSDGIQRELRKSLIWLRDEVRNLPCTYRCRHDAAADLIHVYAHTKWFFRIQEYKAITSPPVYISPLDLGPKCTDMLGSGLHEYCKTYGENYCLGQLIFWHSQANVEPDCSLTRASRGCLSLPDVGSFYAKVHKPSRQRIYGPRTVKFMVARMEKQRQRPWPKDWIWLFETSPKIFGSPMLDTVLDETPLDKEMVHWLKHRPPIFQAPWDR
ncbi:hypothetical protein RJ640_011251 [Escallonia rubra]|uniref:SET domain-containing protein n=1 Tax=Escallonia rubra TaxID=112253 RepID=A0AA88UNT2_9ASTE|nr:hypothetical protein RJ640_011251 [Escallonia rubra]